MKWLMFSSFYQQLVEFFCRKRKIKYSFKSNASSILSHPKTKLLSLWKHTYSLYALFYLLVEIAFKSKLRSKRFADHQNYCLINWKKKKLTLSLFKCISIFLSLSFSVFFPFEFLSFIKLKSKRWNMHQVGTLEIVEIA